MSKKKNIMSKKKPEKEEDLGKTVSEVFEVEKEEEKQFTLEGEIKDILEIVNSGIERTEEIVEVTKIMSYIDERLTERRYKELTGDILSRAATKLSILNINIGVKAAEATMQANMGYGYRKFQYASEWRATKERIAARTGKVTNEDVKNDLELKNWKHFKQEMEEKLRADKLIALNQGIDSLLMAIGYRLKALMQDRMTTKYQQ